MASSSSSCCPDNSWGAPLDVKHDIKTLDDGVKESLLKIGPEADLEIYVTTPSSLYTTSITNNLRELSYFNFFVDSEIMPSSSSNFPIVSFLRRCLAASLAVGSSPAKT